MRAVVRPIARSVHASQLARMADIIRHSPIVEEEPIQLVDYDPSWPKRFERERVLLLEALAPWLAGPIEHVGSTAIPDMVAKPVIDIAAAVKDLASSASARAALADLSYMYFPYRPDDEHWFCKPSPAHRTHHLHLVPVQSQLWRDRLDFRDYLRLHAGAAREYAALKQSLAVRFRLDREGYTAAKEPFIRHTLAAAGS
jgi:GrpB-like predicted nucleotidyltransferase (UPF0157 family)